MDDAVTLIEEAHKRGIRVIADLVVNHTSDQHAWFQESRSSKDNPKADWYVWGDDESRWSEARIIFVDSESSNWAWDSTRGQFYWHRFYSHQPDLNYANPEVRAAMLDVVDYWLGVGLDGFRLDAVPYLFEADGTNGENLPATHEYLRELRAHVDQRFPGRVLLAEANQWPEDVVEYFGDGDECHMCFHFPLMPRMFMALRRQDASSVHDILAGIPSIPDGCQWGIFLRNHDELTLEMVTDEERDYMYQQYATDPRMRRNVGISRRLFPLVEGDRRQAELLHSLLFTLPGTPILYYGDEIGMGDNINLGDRDGVRTPMQWTPDRNGGFSQGGLRLRLPAAVDGSGLRVRGAQRRVEPAQPGVVPAVDAPDDPDPPGAPDPRPRRAHAAPGDEQRCPGLHPNPGVGAAPTDPVRRQLLRIRPARGAGARGARREPTDRAPRRGRVPEDRRAALPVDPAAVRIPDLRAEPGRPDQVAHTRDVV